ncbi:ADP-ribosylglycohydrolase family protein, partial [Streptococcus suis]
MTRIAAAVNAAGRQESTLEFANLLGLGKGVTGFILDTVPVVVHAWLSHPEYLHAAVSALILCGGDADTTAAIVGGLVGVRVGGSGIP